MKIVSALFLLIAVFCLSNCAELPARHVESGHFDRAFVSGAYQFMGNSEDHSFLKKSNGNLIYTDTEYLEPEVQAKIAAQGKLYTGPYSRIAEH